MTLKTRPENYPGIEYILPIHWQDFSHVGVVEDVRLDLEKHETERSQGTETIIEGLNFKLGKREVQRLARELLLLSDPFKDTDTTGFHPKLIAPGFFWFGGACQKSLFR